MNQVRKVLKEKPHYFLPRQKWCGPLRTSPHDSIVLVDLLNAELFASFVKTPLLLHFLLSLLDSPRI